MKKQSLKTNIQPALFFFGAGLKSLAKKHRQKRSPKTFLKILPAIIALTLSLSSCEKLIEVDDPRSQLSATAAFNSETTTKAVLNNLYGASMGVLGGGSTSPTMLGAMSSDETDIYSTSQDIKALGAGQLVPSNTLSGSLWPACYQLIYNANTLLEGTTGNPALSEPLKKQCRGEALFFRALAHLTLTGFYGKVPIVTSTDYRENTTKARSEEKLVLAQVISDLTKSAQLLPSDYSASASERIRANAMAARALLARAYLYIGDNEKAESAATEVISNTALYAILPLGDVFLKNSREAILQIRSSISNINSADGNQFVLSGRPTLVALRQGFVDGFETGDLRKASWTAKFTIGAESWNYPAKYKVKTSTTITEYSTLLRLAETYLIRSEARARQNRLALAIADLDIVRSRAGLTKIAITDPSISQSALLDKILQERRSELFTEWAHRFIDLKRFGKAQDVLPLVKLGWRASALFYPIPQSETNINPNLGQNPGY